jgi:hypothetical protein
LVVLWLEGMRLVPHRGMTFTILYGRLAFFWFGLLCIIISTGVLGILRRKDMFVWFCDTQSPGDGLAIEEGRGCIEGIVY